MTEVERLVLESLERIAAGLVDETGRARPEGPRMQLTLSALERLHRLRAEAASEGVEGVPSGADKAGTPNPVR